MTAATNWRDRAPSMLLDTLTGPDGEPCFTTTDRRWLWRLEGFLAVSATNARQREMAADLRQYLNETCEHHWRNYEAKPGDAIGTHRQCLWCAETEWPTAAGGWAAEVTA